MNISEITMSDDVKALNPELNTVPVQPPRNKYHNKKTTLDGITFDSGKEAARAKELLLLHQAKQIFALAFQVPFPLPGGITYVADFVYLDENLQPVIEDCKGMLTKEYKLKRKLFREKYGLTISENKEE